MDEQVNGVGEAALEGYIAHRMPGRVRIRVPAAKGRPELLERIAQAAGSADIERLECNPLTGSVLISYRPEAYKDIQALSSLFANARLRVSEGRPAYRSSGGTSSASPRKILSKQSAAAKAIKSIFRTLDREIRVATNNEVDLKVLLPLIAGVLGFVASRKKAATPLWLTLFIFAFHSFLALHSEIDGQAMTEPPIEP